MIQRDRAVAKLGRRYLSMEIIAIPTTYELGVSGEYLTAYRTLLHGLDSGSPHLTGLYMYTVEPCLRAAFFKALRIVEAAMKHQGV
jgi:hypothetical protein